MDNLARITLSGAEYPLKCDNFVLAQVQEKFGTLAAFEMALTGREIIKNSKGEPKKDSKGNTLYKKVEPSMDAMNFFLPLCVQEGLQIEAELENRPVEKITNKKIVMLCDMNPFALALELTKEFYRSMATKK